MPAPYVVVGILVAGAMYVINSASALFPPVRRFHEQESNARWPNLEPDISSLIMMRRFEEVSINEYATLAERNGYSHEVSEKMFRISETLLSVADYITLWRREEITESKLDGLLSNLGLNKDDITDAKKVTEYFPSPADLVHFAVREVYTPTTVAEYGMLQDLPSEFMAQAKKAGLPEEQARNYWAAHWELPSAGMGYRMLHRRIINKEQLGGLLKALDVMPFWRDALIKLSYNPLTRVDVRRMYRVGTLDEDGVLNAYLDTGYSPENAQKMLEFTLQYENRDNVGITRSNVIKAYKQGLLTENNLKSYLETLGYNDQVVNFWLSMAVYEKEQDDLDDTVDELVAQYRLGILSEELLTQGLRSLNLPDAFVLKTVSKAVGNKSAKTKLPSMSELHGWLQSEIIGEEGFSDYLKLLGYRESDIVNYMTAIRFGGGTGKRKYLPIKTYEAWLKKGVISANQFQTIASDMDISSADINRMIELSMEG